jgi:hypothetical protein
MSRESVHFGTIVESALPMITDSELFNPLEEDLKQLSDRFRDRIGKFLQRKKRKKELYKIGKQRKFYMYELVMKADYTADSMLAVVYKGPYRIINLDHGGARLRDTKTGEELSASYEHIRKIKIDELLTLLPQNFDSEIASVLETYRYRKGSTHGEAEQDKSAEKSEKVEADNETQESGNKRMLRSGRLYNIGISNLGHKIRKETERAYWRTEKLYSRDKTQLATPILIYHSASEREFDFETKYNYKEERKEPAHNAEYMYTERRKYDKYKSSSFSSDTAGTMVIRLKRENNERPGKRVKFKEAIIHFY